MTETTSTTPSAAASVAEAVRDLADGLMAAPAYRSLVTAADRVRADAAVAHAIRAAEEQQARLQRDEARVRGSAAAWRELDQLWAEVERQPAVVAYREAERALIGVCQEVNGVLSEILGLDFAAHARRGCCG